MRISSLRISTDRNNDDMRFHARRREREVNNIMNKLGTGTGWNDLGEDPSKAAHATRNLSKMFRIEKYSENASAVMERYTLAEVNMERAIEDMQTIREWTVQAANGSYNADDLNAIARSVNVLLNDIVDTANTSDEYGNYIFSGTDSGVPPFNALYGRVEGMEEEVIIGVSYHGNIGERKLEVADGVAMEMNFPGNRVFWAEQQQIYSSAPADTFRVPADTSISIDGTEIPLKAGDSVSTIVEKINAAPLAVKASLDPVSGALNLRTTIPHQMWIEEPPESTVMRDLGILSDEAGGASGLNFDPTARVSGGSLFDTLVGLRDALLRGDQNDIGTRMLGKVSLALESINTRRTDLGAKFHRAEKTRNWNNVRVQNYTEMDARERSVNISEAAMELKALETMQRAVYLAAARTLQPTLMDFLR